MTNVSELRKCRIVVGTASATGALYSIQLLKRLRQFRTETHFVFSRRGKYTVEHEAPYTIVQARAMADHVHAPTI